MLKHLVLDWCNFDKTRYRSRRVRTRFSASRCLPDARGRAVSGCFRCVYQSSERLTSNLSKRERKDQPNLKVSRSIPFLLQLYYFYPLTLFSFFYFSPGTANHVLARRLFVSQTTQHDSQSLVHLLFLSFSPCQLFYESFLQGSDANLPT